MVNGLPGKMASEAAKAIVRSRDINLLPLSLTGPDIEASLISLSVNSNDDYDIFLFKPENRGKFAEEVKNGHFISVDFTHPSAVNDNTDFYCRHGLPFVMGTTGGDRKALEERVRNSEICAVIAPNMAKQIVAFQRFMETYASQHSDSLKGCRLQIVESHQQGKVDTSGTAKAMVKYFNQLGIPYSSEGIEIFSLDEIDFAARQGKVAMIRNPELQRKIRVPEEHLKGHGWHTYKIYPGKGDRGPLLSLFERLKDFLVHNKSFESYGTYGDSYLSTPFSALVRRSSDNNVELTVGLKEHCDELYIVHNVNGRSIYAQGTLDAIRFLDRKVKAGEKGKTYSMIDVLNDEA